MRVSATPSIRDRLDNLAALAMAATRRIKPRPAPAAHPVVAALERAGRPLSNKELAKALGCSDSHASRLRRQAGEQVVTFKRGRRVYAALPAWKVQ